MAKTCALSYPLTMMIAILGDLVLNVDDDRQNCMATVSRKGIVAPHTAHGC